MKKYDRSVDDARGVLPRAEASRELVASLAAGYALQHLFNSVSELREARNESDIRTEQDMRASVVAAKFLVEWFQEKGVTFEEDARPIVPAAPLELSHLKSLHADAMHLAFLAIVSAGRVTEELWSDSDRFTIWFIRSMETEAFKAGAPNQLWKVDRHTHEIIEMRREVCARLVSTGQLVDLEGFPASPFPRRVFPGIIPRTGTGSTARR